MKQIWKKSHSFSYYYICFRFLYQLKINQIRRLKQFPQISEAAVVRCFPTATTEIAAPHTIRRTTSAARWINGSKPTIFCLNVSPQKKVGGINRSPFWCGQALESAAFRGFRLRFAGALGKINRGSYARINVKKSELKISTANKRKFSFFFLQLDFLPQNLWAICQTSVFPCRANRM